MAYERENARLSSPFRLRARFFDGGVLFDPALIENIEIFKHGDGADQGGVLVDVISGTLVTRIATGIYEIVVDLLLTGSPGSASPFTGGFQGDHSPASTSPNDPTAITTGRYYDRWNFRRETNGPALRSTGLTFFLYPDDVFVDSDTSKWRFECKLDRKLIVKGEDLDIRLQIIPIPLYRALREPLVSYLLPISTMRARVVDAQNNEIIAWSDVRFTGKEGIMPTAALAAAQLGSYFIQAELVLPNGQSLRYPKQAITLID